MAAIRSVRPVVNPFLGVLNYQAGGGGLRQRFNSLKTLDYVGPLGQYVEVNKNRNQQTVHVLWNKGGVCHALRMQLGVTH